MKKLFLSVVCLGLLLPTNVSAQDKDKPDQKKKEAQKEKPKKEETPRQVINTLIRKGQLKDAAEKLEEAIEADSDNRSLQSLRRSLASAYARKRDYKGAANQYCKQLDASLEGKGTTGMYSTLSMLRLYLPRAGRSDELMPYIERVETAFNDRIDAGKPSSLLKELLMVHNLHAQALARADKDEAAEDLLRDDLEKMTALHEQHDSKITGELKATSMRNLFASLDVGKERRELFDRHQILAQELIDDGNAAIATNFMSAGMSQVSRVYRSDPDYASEVLDSLKSFLKETKEDKDIAKRVSFYSRSVASYESRIKAAQKIAKMIGKPAPEFDEDLAWAGTDGQPDMSGKVVLVDFWAIWCGPCIATFPHLQHLNETYGDKGLQIVGVTRYYNYKWNEDTGKAVRGKRDADPDVEAEHEALKEFLASHDLSHPTAVVQKGSEMHKAFGVTGIPHAVLIDQKGNIQMVKIGSSKQNAEDIEAKVRELLGLGSAAE